MLNCDERLSSARRCFSLWSMLYIWRLWYWILRMTMRISDEVTNNIFKGKARWAVQSQGNVQKRSSRRLCQWKEASLEVPIPKPRLPKYILDFVAAGCLQLHDIKKKFRLLCYWERSPIHWTSTPDLSEKNFTTPGVWCACLGECIITPMLTYQWWSPGCTHAIILSNFGIRWKKHGAYSAAWLH